MNSQPDTCPHCGSDNFLDQMWGCGVFLHEPDAQTYACKRMQDQLALIASLEARVQQRAEESRA